MTLCPLCNSFKQLNENCPNCQIPLIDGGRVADYLDPYGHYNDIETVKSGDGYLYTIKNELCPHLLYCQQCNHDEVVFVREQLM